MSDSPTKRYIREEGPKVYDLLVKIAFPILLGCSAWTFNSLWDHNNRLTQIESSRFTAADAAPLFEDVADIKEQLAERRGSDKDTARRLDRIEQNQKELRILLEKLLTK